MEEKADINGYNVMGKTGTAEKPSNIGKGYSNEILNVFVSAFDVEKFICFNSTYG